MQKRLIMEDIKISDTPDELIASCACDAALGTAGVSGLVSSGVSSIIDKDGQKGIKISDDKDGAVVDVWLTVAYGTKIPETAWNIQENVKKRIKTVSERKISKVNIHIMGVTATNAVKEG